MQLTNVLAIMAMAAATVRAGCTASSHAGAWTDSQKPSDRLTTMCLAGKPDCHAGDQGVGVMCVGGEFKSCQEAIDFAKDIESWHGSWWLEDRIECDGFFVTITSQSQPE